MAQFLAATWTELTILVAGALYYGLLSDRLDALLLASFIYLDKRLLILECLEPRLPWVYTGLGIAVVAQLIRLQVWRRIQTKPEQPVWNGLGKVLLFPCKTTHSRLFPKKHSFSYSYLVVGIPVGWEGSVGGLVSSTAKPESAISRPHSLKPAPPKAWYDVDANDYLERGNGHLGLRGKLDAYLESQGIDPAEYPHGYLVTAARFLGYQFNPASFWYLYDEDKALAAMIVEVNNTFDERRMYFLLPDPTPHIQGMETGSSRRAVETPRNNNVATALPPVTFTQTWPKDFHVSPFNSRKGSYSIRANDPLSPGMQGPSSINNTIVLSSSKSHGKIIARLFSEGPAVDPNALTSWQKLKFLTAWSWVGFVTFPRIVKEAGRLFFKRKLHVWFRPEPLRDSIGRLADKTERRLEAVFRKYLRYLVQTAGEPLAMKYIPSGISSSPSGELMLTPAARKGSVPVQEVEFKVLTPAFYSRFVYYAHDLEALFCEFRENSTIWISRPDLLPKLVLKKPLPILRVSSMVDFVFFRTIQCLRRRPEHIKRPMTWPTAAPSRTEPPGTHTVTDIRGFRISSMDSFVLSHADRWMKSSYKWSVIKLLIADRVSFGAVSLLEAQCFILRAGLAWIFAGGINSTITHVSLYL